MIILKIKKIIFSVFAFQILFFQQPLLAEEPLGLNQYLETGLTNSASLKSAYESYYALLQRNTQVRTLPDPTISYGNFIRSVETRVGSQKNKFGLSQSVPWFGTLSLRGEIADLEANAEFNRFISLKNQLVFQITSNYAELTYINSATEIVKSIKQLVETWEEVLQERFRTGTSLHSDIVRVQLELGKLEDKLLELEDLKNPLTVSFNSLLNRDAFAEIQTTEAFLSSNKNISVTFDEILKNNSELMMMESAIKAKNSGISLAEKKFFPDFTFGVDYIGVGDSGTSSGDGGKDAVIGLVSINVPLYWNKNEAAVIEAKARKKSFEELKKDREFQLRAELAKAKFNYRDSKRKIKLYKNTLIPKAEESIDASYTAYKTGNTGFLEVLEAEQRFLEFNITLKRSLADRIIAATKLEQLAGGFNDVKTEIGNSANEVE